MNDYNIVFKGTSGNIDIIDYNNIYQLKPYTNTNITKPVGLRYVTKQISSTTDTLIIQSKHCYYSIIMDSSILAKKEDYFYYFLYLNELLDQTSSPKTSIYGASIIEKNDITNFTLNTTVPYTFTNISHTATISKKPIYQTSSYVGSHNGNFITLLKNNNALFASCSFLNGNNHISFCGSYESPMDQFLLYNSNDILIHKNSSLEYNDLCFPINLTINFANSV